MEAATGEMLLGARAVVNPGLLQYHKQFEALRSHSSGKCGIFAGYSSGRHRVRCGEMQSGRQLEPTGGAQHIEADAKQPEREETAKHVDNE